MPYSRFLGRISRCKENAIVFKYLENHVQSPIDYSDILRAQISNVVSAFDTLIHDIIHDEMLSCFMGNRPHTAAFREFALPMKTVEELMSSNIPREILFSRHIRSYFKRFSFQKPKEISKGPSLIWGEDHKWRKISDYMQENESDVVTQFRLIVVRRNSIVHESDFDPITMSLNQISSEQCEASIEFMERCGEAVVSVI